MYLCFLQPNFLDFSYQLHVLIEIILLITVFFYVIVNSMRGGIMSPFYLPFHPKYLNKKSKNIVIVVV